MKIMFRLFWFVIFSFIGTLNYSYNNSCGAYSDEFGPLQTGYTMGDLVRYTVTPNLNQYSTLIAPPAGAQDIAKFDSANRRNLYNALGYLYAGWALVNYRLQVPYSTANTGHLQHSLVHPNFQTKWLKNYRHAGGGSLDELDNNVQGLRAILFPPNPGQSYGGPSVWAYVPQPGENSANFQDVMQAGNEPNANHGNAISSCGWCSNTNNSDYMLVTGTSTVPSPFVMPTGQFFGARIAHILGVVVNDVPWTDDETITNAGFAPNPTTTNPTGSAAKPTSYTTTLISGSDGTGTALPMFATMNHGPWGSTQAPKEMIQNSTAHFGSIATFLKNASIP
ncbi:MAG TPA: hypothetical protein VLG50_08485, partial [Candidatus Saccharimonadales bacterium]|nr:hypothetical protein [Candidatus Saccharimonadales bacterium]